MPIEPFKYLVQPVAVERDDNGRVVREMPAEVVSVYSAEQAVQAITEFESTLEEMSRNGDRPENREKER